MTGKTIRIKTFNPPANCRGENGPDFVGTIRKGELRGIIKINKDLCEACDTCRKVCPSNAIIGALGAKHEIDNQRCLSCGQCLVSCPFNAIEQMSFVDEVDAMLADKSQIVVVHPSPAVRVAIAEEFGAKPGDLTTEQMMNAFDKLGFKTYDVNNSADQTIMEEGTEFVRKVQYWVLGKRGPEFARAAHHPLPHFTSCCPAWVRNCETFHADFIPHLSTAKSPIQMGGVVAKVWAAKELYGTDPRKVKVVSVTPCTAKILEASRPEMNNAWRWHVKNGTIPADTPSFPDIDATLTARDAAELMRRKGINPLNLPKERKRENLDIYTGAGTIFGNSGGVMEAALRTAYRVLMGKELDNADIIPVRGLDNSYVEAKIPLALPELNGKTFELRVCVVNGANQSLKHVLDTLRGDPTRWHFIEVMNCPGGCVNGGGQPVQPNGTGWLKPLFPLPTV
ncbi:MAG: [Fe-Fe] hydrogenase large subunit C-terminal domain-containing protein [Duodenibacillus sp.]|nr:[Fe-Fe] hydrogenase large subunit C-terminal domain-containing protein [Duodenibacillus sp.]